MLHDLFRITNAQSRSISPENFSGEKGKGGMALTGTGAEQAQELGQGWKISPSVVIEPGETFQLADIQGPGQIEQMWMTPTGVWRWSILRIYWDDQPHPAVECPVGDFFACGWGEFAPVSSLAVCVNPGSAFNCYWPMPFKRRCRITLENIANEPMTLYYQICPCRTTSPPWPTGARPSPPKNSPHCRTRTIWRSSNPMKGVHL